MLVAIFAYMPVVWISSIVTMDYWWALTFLLWCYYLTLTGRPYWGAVLLGLATGCRLTSGFLILPILLMVWQDSNEWKKLVRVSLIFAATAFLTWLPLLLSYGFEHFTFVPYAHPFVVGAYRAVRQIMGIPALVVMLIAVIISWAQSRRDRSAQEKRESFVMLPVYLWIIITVAIFIRVPADPAYLLPSLPFLLIVFDSLITVFWWIPIGALIILNNLVSFIAVDSNAYKSSGSFLIKLAAPGVLLKDRIDAHKSRETIAELQSLTLDMPDDEKKPLILTGALMPELHYYFRHQVLDRKIVGISPHDIELIQIGDRWFGRSLSLETFQVLVAEGFAIFYTLEAHYATVSTFNYNLKEVGARKVN
jgi:hypothetical protein